MIHQTDTHTPVSAVLVHNRSPQRILDFGGGSETKGAPRTLTVQRDTFRSQLSALMSLKMNASLIMIFRMHDIQIWTIIYEDIVGA